MTSPIERIAALLVNSQRLIAFTGAGISTPSGIPDFRSQDSGLWEQVDAMMVASIFGFRQNPQAFYEWVRPLASTMIHAQPNAAHLALAELEQLGKLQAIITQNIDMLHSRAGNQTVWELHGHLREATCIRCFKLYPMDDQLIEYLIEARGVPHCPACGGVLKPNVILFDEQLPYQQLQAAQLAAKQCDVMLVVGSSLEVAPASDLPVMAKRNGAKVILINLQPTFFDTMADSVIYGDCAEVLPAILEAYHLSQANTGQR